MINNQEVISQAESGDLRVQSNSMKLLTIILMSSLYLYSETSVASQTKKNILQESIYRVCELSANKSKDSKKSMYLMMRVLLKFDRRLNNVTTYNKILNILTQLDQLKKNGTIQSKVQYCQFIAQIQFIKNI
jgi:hypothetical protein